MKIYFRNFTCFLKEYAKLSKEAPNSYLNKGSASRFFETKQCICYIICKTITKKFYSSLWEPAIQKILYTFMINFFFLAQWINLSNLKINYYIVLFPKAC